MKVEILGKNEFVLKIHFAHATNKEKTQALTIPSVTLETDSESLPPIDLDVIENDNRSVREFFEEWCDRVNNPVEECNKENSDGFSYTVVEE